MLLCNTGLIFTYVLFPFPWDSHGSPIPLDCYPTDELIWDKKSVASPLSPQPLNYLLTYSLIKDSRRIRTSSSGRRSSVSRRGCSGCSCVRKTFFESPVSVLLTLSLWPTLLTLRFSCVCSAAGVTDTDGSATDLLDKHSSQRCNASPSQSSLAAFVTS